MENNILLNKNIPKNLKKSKNAEIVFKTVFSLLDKYQELFQDPKKILDSSFISSLFSTDLEKNVLNDFKNLLLKYYFNELYIQLDEFKSSSSLNNYFKHLYKSLGILEYFEEIDFDIDIDKVITEEMILASKELKSFKGTLKGFYYIFDIINKINIQKLNAGKDFNFFNVEELGNFKYKIETNYFRKVVKESFIPLNHPLGFGYKIISLIFLKLTDNFNYLEKRNLIKLSMLCLNNGSSEETDLLHYKPKIRNISLSFNDKENTEIILDFYPENPKNSNDIYGFRIIKDFENKVYILNKQDGYVIQENDLDGNFVGEQIFNEISSIKFNENLGEFYPVFESKTIFGKNVKVLKGFYFKGFTIQNIKSIPVEIEILNGIPNKKYNINIPVDLTVSEDKRYYLLKFISREDIISSGINEIDGILLKSYDNCKISEKIEIEYKQAVSDVSKTIQNIYSEDEQDHHLELSELQNTFDLFGCKDVQKSIIGRFNIGEPHIQCWKNGYFEKFYSENEFVLFKNQEYSVNTYQKALVITSETNSEINTNYIGGIIYKKNVDAEIFEFDNNSDEIKYSGQKEIQENYKIKFELLKNKEDYSVYDLFDYSEDNYAILGKKDITLGKFWVYGKPSKIHDEQLTEETYFESQKNIYSYNTYEKGFIIGSQTNGSVGKFYLRGIIERKFVNSDIFTFANDQDLDDPSLFDFGVYDSSGNRIEDNNVSVAS